MIKPFLIHTHEHVEYVHQRLKENGDATGEPPSLNDVACFAKVHLASMHYGASPTAMEKAQAGPGGAGGVGYYQAGLPTAEGDGHSWSASKAVRRLLSLRKYNDGVGKIDHGVEEMTKKLSTILRSAGYVKGANAFVCCPAAVQQAARVLAFPRLATRVSPLRLMMPDR